MADIIDISSKKKRKIDFFKRLEECRKRAEEKGKCECEVCKYKEIITDKLLLFLLNECKNAPDPIFLGDIQEVLTVATRRFFNFVKELDLEDLLDNEDNNKNE